MPMDFVRIKSIRSKPLTKGLNMFDVLEVAVDQCRLAANNKIQTVAVDIGYVDFMDFSANLVKEMDDNCIYIETVEPGRNFNEAIIRGIKAE